MTKRYWYVILTYIIMQFSGAVFSPLLYLILPISKYDAVVYWSIFSFIAGLIVTLWLMKPDMKSGPGQHALNTSQSAGWVIGGIVMAYFSQAIAVLIEMNLFGITTNSENTQMIMDITRTTPLFIIIPSLIAPILEEIIFRKIIFGGLYKRTNFFIAAILSALIFAMIHNEPEHILIYGSMGFVFAYVYVKTKRIIVPIIVHMSMNTISVIMQLSLSPEEIQKLQEQVQTIFLGS